MTDFIRGTFAVLSGLFALLCAWVGAREIPKGNYAIAIVSVFFVARFGLFSWNCIGRIRAAKRELVDFTKTLETLPYDHATALAQEKCVSVPRELAVRKISPSSKAWLSFEWRAVQFVLEKIEPDARTRVTLIR